MCARSPSLLSQNHRGVAAGSITADDGHSSRVTEIASSAGGVPAPLRRAT